MMLSLITIDQLIAGNPVVAPVIAAPRTPVSNDRRLNR